MLKLILLSTFLLSSCATAKDWSAWREESINLESRIWRFCDKRFDNPELHEKGICFVSNECRTRKTILKNTKKECRRLQLFCEFTDISCLRDYKILNKKIGP